MSTNHANGGADCAKCPAGYVSPRNGTECSPCSAGSSTNGVYGSTQCSKCIPGSYNPGPGEPSCTPCGEGWYGQDFGGQIVSAACYPCPAGFYCPNQVTRNPSTCPEGSFCPQGSRAPTACQALFSSATGAAACSPTGGFYGLIFGLSAAVCVAGIGGYVMWRRKHRRHSEDRPSFTSQTSLDSTRLIPRPKDAPMYSGS
jgi:hypothetical protein